MTLQMPTLESERLRIRPFVPDDLGALHQFLDQEGEMEAGTLEERRAWLQWSVLNYQQLAALAQPPYGDRAIVLKEDDRLIGVCGLVPLLMPFGMLASFRHVGEAEPQPYYWPEVGLYWTVDSAYQRRGYATEAARALIAFAFGTLQLRRIVATTESSNLPSRRVMEHLGMRIEQAPPDAPPWFQIVGVLYNSRPVVFGS